MNFLIRPSAHKCNVYEKIYDVLENGYDVFTGTKERCEAFMLNRKRGFSLLDSARDANVKKRN